jgi:hypothetical protein
MILRLLMKYEMLERAGRRFTRFNFFCDFRCGTGAERIACGFAPTAQTKQPELRRKF